MPAKHHRGESYAAKSERDLERRQRRIRLFISLFMLIILVFSSVAYFFQSDQNSFSYNGHRFSLKTDSNGYPLGFVTRVNGAEYAFSSRPDDSRDIALPPGFIETLTNAQVIVFLFDPKDPNTALYDALRFDLARTTSTPMAATVTEPSTTYPFPLYNCSASTMAAPVVVLMNGTRGITINDTCYVITGTRSDYPLIRDRLMYRFLNITEY